MLKIITPTTKLQIEEYYKLRWSLLRRPWGGKRGSEIDELEEFDLDDDIDEDIDDDEFLEDSDDDSVEDVIGSVKSNKEEE